MKYRLVSKAVQDGDCWVFTGAKSQKGYGVIGLGTRKEHRAVSAHRVSYFVFIGPIPDGLMVCHSCDRPACVNPSHLYVGDALLNNRDREARGRRDVKGERHHNSKLNDWSVGVIRAGGMSDAALGRLFGVDRALVRRIRLRRAWTHIK